MNATRLVLAASFLSLVLGPGVARAQLDNPAYQVQPPVNPFGIKSPRIGEFTGDGIPDLVVSHFGAGQVSFFPGVGDGTFGRAITRAASSSVAMEAGDLDLNGQADLVLGGSEFNVHRTSGVAELSAPYSLGSWNLSALHLADLNHDGLLDVVGVRDTGDWFVWLNTTTFNGGNTQFSLALGEGHTVSATPASSAGMPRSSDARPTDRTGARAVRRAGTTALVRVTAWSCAASSACRPLSPARVSSGVTQRRQGS